MPKTPWGLTSQQAAIYQLGYASAAAPAPLPPATVPPVLAYGQTYYIAPTGSDLTGKGSTLSPFASLPRAVTQAQKDGAKRPSIRFQCGGSYTVQFNWPKGLSAELTSYGSGMRPILTHPTKGMLAFLSTPDVQLSGLEFVGNPSVPVLVAANGCEGFLIEDCIFTGGAIGLSFVGGNVPLFLRSGFFGQCAPGNAKSQGLYIEAAQNWIIDDCFFVHCGWSVPYQFSQDAIFQQSHGVYINETGHTSDGIFTRCLAIDCASSGLASRLGGEVSWSVFRTNGHAADVVLQGIKGSIDHCHFIGPTIDAAPNWGGGIKAISQHVTIDQCTFWNSAMTPLDPAIVIDWPASNGPAPAGMTAAITDCTFHMLEGTFSAANTAPVHRSFTATGSKGQVLVAGAPTPTLNDYYGVSSDAQLYAMLRTRVGLGEAPVIAEWLAQSALALNS